MAKQPRQKEPAPGPPNSDVGESAHLQPRRRPKQLLFSALLLFLWIVLLILFALKFS